MPFPLFRDWPHKPALFGGLCRLRRRRRVVASLLLAAVLLHPSPPLSKLTGLSQRFSEWIRTAARKCQPYLHECLIRDPFAPDLLRNQQAA